MRPEFAFFYDPDEPEETVTVRELYNDAARALLAEAALTRPYGDLASIVYEKAAAYAGTLRRLKKVFDPNNIMNPAVGF